MDGNVKSQGWRRHMAEHRFIAGLAEALQLGDPISQDEVRFMVTETNAYDGGRRWPWVLVSYMLRGFGSWGYWDDEKAERRN